MDFSGLIMLPLAAVISACWLIGAAVALKKNTGFRVPFLLAYGLGILFMEPWGVATWRDLGKVAVMLVMLALWIAAGCILGGIPAALIVLIGTKLRQRFGR